MSVMEKPHSRAELTGIQGMLAKVSVARCRMLHKSCLGVSVMGCSPVLRMPFLCAFLSLPCGGGPPSTALTLSCSCHPLLCPQTALLGSMRRLPVGKKAVICGVLAAATLQGAALLNAAVQMALGGTDGLVAAAPLALLTFLFGVVVEVFGVLYVVTPGSAEGASLEGRADDDVSSERWVVIDSDHPLLGQLFGPSPYSLSVICPCVSVLFLRAS